MQNSSFDKEIELEGKKSSLFMSESLSEAGIDFGESFNPHETIVSYKEDLKFYISTKEETVRFKILKTAKQKGKTHMFLQREKDCSASLILDILNHPCRYTFEINESVQSEGIIFNKDFEYELFLDDENSYYLNIKF